MHRWRTRTAIAAGIGGALLAAGPAAAASASSLSNGAGSAGAVYTMTNSPAGNAIEAFARAADGSLTPAGTYSTGGNGGALGSGHSVTVSSDGSVVVTVNAGSNSISAFAATPGACA
jgi:hypothetical protein